MGKYNIFVELARAPSGLSISQRTRGDAKEAARQIRNLLNLRRRHTMIATEKLLSTAQISRRLKVVSVKIFGEITQALLDMDAVPSLLCSQLSGQLNLQPEKPGRSIKVADGLIAPTCRILKSVSISFGYHTAIRDF